MSIPRSLTLPARARRATVDTADGAFAALRTDADAGAGATAGRRPTVLLLPGFTGSKEDFLSLLDPLALAGYAVVAVDQRGQFETPGAEHVDDELYALDGFARDAVALLAAVDDGHGVHLVGHSFAGLVAQAAVLRDAASVRSLTLMCTGAGALPEQQHGALSMFVNGLPVVGKATAWQMMRNANAAARGAATPEVEAWSAERFVRSSTGSLIGMAKILGSAPSRVDAVVATGVPVHVLFGEDDDAWPVQSQRDHAAQLGAPVSVIAGAGHSPAVDDPEATAAALVGFFSSVEDVSAR